MEPTRPKRGRGRPPGTGKPLKAAGEHYEEVLYARVPVALGERFRAAVPPGERAEFVRQAVERALDERERPASAEIVSRD
jgi:hypothetical protein